MQPRGTPLRRALEACSWPPICRRRAAPCDDVADHDHDDGREADAIAAAQPRSRALRLRERRARALALLPTAFPLVVQPYSLISARKRPLSPAARTVYEAIRELAAAR